MAPAADSHHKSLSSLLLMAIYSSGDADAFIYRFRGEIESWGVGLELVKTGLIKSVGESLASHGTEATYSSVGFRWDGGIKN